MRLLLVNPAHETSLFSTSETADVTGCNGYMPSLALLTLAALTPPSVRLAMLDENVEPHDSFLTQEWDLVAITGFITQRERMRALAEEFRDRGALIAIGGPYASLSPASVRQYADVLFIGEAENTWPEFLRDYLADSWKREYRSDAPVDLSLSPLPNVALANAGSYLSGVVQTSRGCPFECEFCDVIVYLGRRQRYKAPEQVVKELEQLYRTGCRNTFLADDNFAAHRGKAMGILTAVGHWNRDKRERMMFATQLSIDAARDPELLDCAVGAGLKQVFIGIETPNHAALREVKKRQNLRPDVIGDIRMFQRRGIGVQAGIILGFDSDSSKSFREQLAFIQEAGIPTVLVNMLIAPEGTPLERRLRAENRLIDNPVGAGHLDTNIVPKNMSRRELADGTRWLLNRLYSPDMFLDRVSVLAEHSPVSSFPLGWAPSRYAFLWRNLLRAYEMLGPAFRDVPRRAVKLFRHKESTSLGAALLFQLQTVRVLAKVGMWDHGLDASYPFADPGQ